MNPHMLVLLFLFCLTCWFSSLYIYILFSTFIYIRPSLFYSLGNSKGSLQQCMHLISKFGTFCITIKLQATILFCIPPNLGTRYERLAIPLSLSSPQQSHKTCIGVFEAQNDVCGKALVIGLSKCNLLLQFVLPHGLSHTTK